MRHQKEKGTTIPLEYWANILKERKLIDMALPLLEILKVWGFVGGQVLWMLTPFLGREKIAPLAQALEEPETLQRLQCYLIEEDMQV
ncbi:MAG: hypothetical protein JXA33_11855 [Anaerolineae bacterium]|nr:hypothetical protein [Anaerolineae bacterium]